MCTVQKVGYLYNVTLTFYYGKTWFLRVLRGVNIFSIFDYKFVQVEKTIVGKIVLMKIHVEGTNVTNLVCRHLENGNQTNPNDKM